MDAAAIAVGCTIMDGWTRSARFGSEGVSEAVLSADVAFELHAVNSSATDAQNS